MLRDVATFEVYEMSLTVMPVEASRQLPTAVVQAFNATVAVMAEFPFAK
jgi:hypothetical protein